MKNKRKEKKIKLVSLHPAQLLFSPLTEKGKAPFLLLGTESEEWKIQKWIQGIELFLDRKRNIWAQSCWTPEERALQKLL